MPGRGRRLAPLAPVAALAAALATALATALASGSAGAAPVRQTAGDPARGALVYVSNGCGACHVLRAAGSSGTAGPDLDRWIGVHAARLRLPPAVFALSRVAFGGKGMPPYTGQLTPEEIEDIVSYVLDTPTTTPPEGLAPASPSPPPPPPQTATAADVRAWTKAAGLTGSARRGAQVIATAGCLSCHRFLGRGVRRLGAPDLSSGGPRRLTAERLRRLIADPAAGGSLTMPAYGDLGDRDLRALADLLVGLRRHGAGQPRK